MRKGHTLRKAFVTTVATLSTVAAAGCTSQVSVNCDQPSANCGQGGNGSSSTSSGVNPPPPICPAQSPAPDSDCPLPGLECRYEESGNCGWSETATCSNDGRWSVLTEINSCNPPAPTSCPEEVPVAGTPCEPPLEGICEYYGIGCPVEATCENGSWEIWEMDCNPPPPRILLPANHRRIVRGKRRSLRMAMAGLR